MCNYEKLYYMLFNAITDGVRAIENQNFGEEKEILKAAQIQSEEAYMVCIDSADA